MVWRYVDVCAQHLRVFALAALLLPGLMIFGHLLLDQSQPATARIWVEPPTFMLDATPYGGWYGAPAQTEATLMAQLLGDLVGTDWFADRVLSGAEASYMAASPVEKATARQELRNGLVVTPGGGHLLVLEFRGRHAEQAVAVLKTLVTAFSESAPVIHFDQARVPGTAVDQLRAARTAVAQASATLVTGGVLKAKPSQPTVRTGLGALVSRAASEAIQYRRRVAKLAGPQEPDASMIAIPHLQPAIVQVLDPPMVRPESGNDLLKRFWLGFFATIAAELAAVYLIGSHDRRLRSGEDVEQRTGIRYLGSTPRLYGSQG